MGNREPLCRYSVLNFLSNFLKFVVRSGTHTQIILTFVMSIGFLNLDCYKVNTTKSVLCFFVDYLR